MKSLLVSIVLGVLVGLATPAAAQERVLHAAIAGYLVAAFVDISTTEYAIGKGLAHEANPFFRPAVEKGPVAAAVLKGSVHTALAWFLLREHTAHPRLTLVCALALTAGQVAVDVHNARVIGRR